MDPALDVVALDDQRAAVRFDPATRSRRRPCRRGRRRSGGPRPPAGRHRLGLAAAGGEQAARTAHDAEQATVATDLPQQEVAHRQRRTLAISFCKASSGSACSPLASRWCTSSSGKDRGAPATGRRTPEVFQHFLSRQRLAGSFRTHAATVDEIQAAGVAQQVVQVQVGLPEAFACSSPWLPGLRRAPLLGTPGAWSLHPHARRHRGSAPRRGSRTAASRPRPPAARRPAAPGWSGPGPRADAPFQFALECRADLAAHQQLGYTLRPTPFAAPT